MGTPSPGTVQKTRRMLAAALVRLLEKKNFTRVTVQDICTEALVSRSAFYQHFSDKYDLLNAVFEEKLVQQEAENMQSSMQERLRILLQNVQTERRLLLNSISGGDDREAMDVVQNVIRRSVEAWLSRSGLFPAEDLPTAAAFCEGGVSAVVADWLRGSCRESADVIANRLYMLISCLTGTQYPHRIQ